MTRQKPSAPEPETTSSQSQPKGRKTRSKHSVPGPEAVGHSEESLPDDSANRQTVARNLRSLRSRKVATDTQTTKTATKATSKKATVPEVTPPSQVITSTVSKKRPAPSPKVSEKVKAARVSSKKGRKRSVPATGDRTTSNAVVNPTHANEGKTKCSRKGQAFHLAPSMDIDSDASAESVPESEEVSSNHSADESDSSGDSESTESRSQSNDHGEDVEGPVDVQMISRALNEAEHATFGGDSDADVDPDVTIRAINPGQLFTIDSEPEGDTDNEAAPTSTPEEPVRNRIRRTYAVQDLRSLHSQALNSRATSEPSSVSSGDLVRPSKPQTKKAARLAKQRQNEIACWDVSDGTGNSNNNAFEVDEAHDEPSDAGEHAWPKWTDLKHQGLVANLTSQSAEVQEIARAMIGATTERIIFDEAYPNEDERIRNLRKMMKDIAISFGHHDVAKRVECEKNYFMILSTIPSRRLNNFNSIMRTSANNAASLYHIPFYKGKGLDQLDIAKNYIFPLKDGQLDVLKPYLHPGLIHFARDCLIKNKFFTNYQARFPRHNGETEMPINLVAYIATLLHTALIKKLGGFNMDGEGMSRPASVIYQEHQEILNTLQQSKKKNALYHQVMSTLFHEATGMEVRGVAQTSKTLQLMDVSPIKPLTSNRN